MRLTVYTDYALRLLMYLALKDDAVATISEVATSYGISRNHLMKVAYELGAAGYIETIRGRGGGLRLAKPAEWVRLGDIVRCTEPDMALVTCFKPVEAPCTIKKCCVLRGALERAREAFNDVLDDYSLADLVQPRSRLKNLLWIASARTASAAAAGSI